MTKSSAKIAVETYKGVKNSTVKISKAQFIEIRRTVRESGISEGEETTSREGCTGGTSEEISLFEGAKQTLNASVYHCGGNHGRLKGNTNAVKAKLKSLFPKLSKTLK